MTRPDAQQAAILDLREDELERIPMDEIASLIDIVSSDFGGDQEKTAAWFRAKNPLLGDVSPRDMIRLGRHDRLRKFIEQAPSTGGNPLDTEAGNPR